MARVLLSKDWRRLSKAPREERNPKKFVYLLKQLYDVLNKERRSGKHTVESSPAKGADSP
jgi:hypothetical protein